MLEKCSQCKKKPKELLQLKEHSFYTYICKDCVSNMYGCMNCEKEYGYYDLINLDGIKTYICECGFETEHIYED